MTTTEVTMLPPTWYEYLKVCFEMEYPDMKKYSLRHNKQIPGYASFVRDTYRAYHVLVTDNAVLKRLPHTAYVKRCSAMIRDAVRYYNLTVGN